MPKCCLCFSINLVKYKKKYNKPCPICGVNNSLWKITNDGELTGFCRCGYKLWDHYDYTSKCYCIECSGNNYKFIVTC